MYLSWQEFYANCAELIKVLAPSVVLTMQASFRHGLVAAFRLCNDRYLPSGNGAQFNLVLHSELLVFSYLGKRARKY